jgi:hypothetical protein
MSPPDTSPGGGRVSVGILQIQFAECRDIVGQMAVLSRRSHRSLLRPVASVLLAVVAVLGPSAGGGSTVEAASGYAVNLYRQGDFVRQTNLVQCVGTSMQMMINMLAPANDGSASTQFRLQTVARLYSDLLSPRIGRKGASVWGWAAGLNQLGYGPYRVAGFTTIDEALHAAAHAIRFTGRPVGLLMWRGRHAWVMSGFRATADPRRTQAFRVTDAYVLDPLYPSTNPTWGPSPAPGARLTVAQLGRDFVARRSNNGSARSRSLGGPWVIVMPVEPAPVVVGRSLLAG